MSDHIEITHSDGICTLRMNRPDKKNALTRAMYAAMTNAINASNDDEATRAIVFLGAPGAFSAGNDMADFMSFSKGDALGNEVLDFLDALVGSQKPLIAGVDGLAIGIGTTLVMHCDVTLASDRTLFRTPFVDLGLVPEAGSSLLGPRIMGHQNAFAMLALGEDFSAEDARACGLIRKVTSVGDLEAETMACAKRVASKPPLALKQARQLLRDPDGTLKDRMDHESKLFAEHLTSKEAQMAMMAFMMRKAG